jgi:hypothetical protein
VPIALKGGRVLLTVRGADGATLRDFGLGVERADEPLRFLSEWSLVARRDRDLLRPDRADAGPLAVWLPPGPARIVVRSRGFGTGTEEIDVPADGSTVEATVHLDPTRIPQEPDIARLLGR